MSDRILNFQKGKQWRRSFAFLAVALAMALLVSACGQGESPKSSSSTPAATPPKPTSAEPAPGSAEPAKPVAKVSQKIKDTYQWYCTQCHGVHGKGDGINAGLVTVLPRDHTKAYYLEGRTDEQLFTAIKEGGLAVGRAPCMPAWGHTFDDDTIHGLVRYIRELCDCEAS